MVGISDGLGAFDNGDGTFTVLMNHEIANTLGVTRAHGAKVLAGGVASIAVASPAFDPAKSHADQTGPRMLDNMTVNDRGQVISLEDVGNNAYLGGVYQYDPSTGGLTRIAEHDPERFGVGGAAFITQDEESSGVIPAPFLGNGKYLIDVQNHRASPDPELVEGGQLLVMQVPSGKPVG
jgi:hypothetical protein